jgi:hypothetical protein
MGQRLDLQALLETLTPNVYFQPPTDDQIQYPCIVYNFYNEVAEFADNIPYTRTNRYSVTVIDQDPDTPIKDKVASLPMCLNNRFFVAGNLNHYVYNLYY